MHHSNHTIDGNNQLLVFREQEVSFINPAVGITLAGTLTFPNPHPDGTKVPVVLLIAGMGPMDRDATFLEYKPFLAITRHLAEQGFAVLRFDKRGIGQSTGTFDQTVTSQDLAGDVQAAINFLLSRSDIDTTRIALLGHSEGGLIASMLASSNKQVAAVVLMAPAIDTSIQASCRQAALQLKADGASSELINRDSALREKLLITLLNEQDPEVAKQKAQELFTDYWQALPDNLQQEVGKYAYALSQKKIDAQINTFNSRWYRFFSQYNAVETLSKIIIPLLAICGDKDWVTSPEASFPIIQQGMMQAHNQEYSLVTVPNVNHSMWPCVTGAFSEYWTIKKAISEQVLTTISDWLMNHL